MAPNKPKSNKGSKPSKSKSALASSKPRKPTLPSKRSEVKTRRTRLSKPKTRTYTEKELGIPTLNMITPAGVHKQKGKKKGKVFVDDQQSMMTILALVNAEKEGQIESKMMKARQLEEIREARRQEAEARQEQKRSKLEETKDALRRKRKHKNTKDNSNDTGVLKFSKKTQKRVSFG